MVYKLTLTNSLLQRMHDRLLPKVMRLESVTSTLKIGN